MTTLTFDEIALHAERVEAKLTRYVPLAALVLMAVLLLFCPDAMAQSTSTDDPGAKVSGFFTKIIAALKPISLAIVTIAFIFAGYQIAFNHKRVIDVAPILVGAIVIGAAAQLASWFLG